MEVHGDRVSVEVHGDRVSVEVHGDRVSMEVHGDRVSVEVHGVNMEVHGSRVSVEEYCFMISCIIIPIQGHSGHALRIDQLKKVSPYSWIDLIDAKISYDTVGPFSQF